MSAMLGDLPVWDLTDLYSSPTGADIEADLRKAGQDAAKFAESYEGKIAGLDGKALAKSIADYEALQDRMGRLGSYAGLYYAQKMDDPERGTEHAADLAAVGINLNDGNGARDV